MKSFFKDLDHATSQSLSGRFSAAIARDTPITQPIQHAVEVGDWEFLCNGAVAYHNNTDLVSILGERQILAFYAKNLAVPLGVDRRKVAFDKFVESELSCQRINKMIQGWSRTGHSDSYVESVLFTAQRKIASILGSSDLVPGSFPALSDLDLSFGPGANVNVKKNTSARWKLSSRPACSTNMLGIVDDVLSELPLLCDFWKIKESDENWTVPVDVECGQLMFVAKNAKTDRSIIIEPSLNTMLQRGIGKFMKSRLLKFGINLFDQNEGKNSNRRRALMASIDGRLATIDLSSASDTIAKELVKELLPYDWYSLLESCRTGYVVCKEYEYSTELEKFSSMGNGFTFELETLIFYALTFAVCEVEGIVPDVTVYGDDIIAPVEVFDKLRYVFNEVGFTINKEKSYASGPFRESCGGDYFLGQDVRPFYQKSNWSMASLFSFHNFIIRKGLHYIFPELFREVLNAIPTGCRIFGPDGYGDGHLIGDHPRTPYRADRGWGGYTFITRIQHPLSIKKYLLPGDYLLPFYSAMVGSGGSNHFSIRGSSKRVRDVRVYTLSR